MTMSPAAVVALGARTPVGLTAETTAAAIRAGISRVGTHPFMLDGVGDGIRTAFDARLDPCVFGWKRLVTFCRSAVEETLGKLGKPDQVAMPVWLSLSLPEYRPGFSAADAQALVDSLRRVGPAGEWSLKVDIVGRGHAGGLLALEHAMRRLERQEHELHLVGGVESYLVAETVDWLRANRQMTGPGVRGGFIPGEGAGVVALANLGFRRRLRLPALASVRAVGTAQETKLIKTDAFNLGEALAETLRRAASDANGPIKRIDAVYCDINGERYRSEEWGLAILRQQTLVMNPDYIAPADCWGDVGAATGPLLCGLAVRSWARKYARGPLALVWAGSESGLRAAAILEEPSGV
jgi:3-oxoacyl-[acyl-carrier-protein] synthase I